MINRLLKIIPYKTAAFILAIVTAMLFYTAVHFAVDYSRSKPMPFSPSDRNGWGFTVITMKSNYPVELDYKWPGLMLEQRDGHGSNGRELGHYRYYLGDADLQKASSQLNSKPNKYPHKVTVEVLEDDPAAKRQTLQVTVRGDRTNFISVYKVEHERVKPLGWTRYRPIEAHIVALALFPFAFGISLVFWRMWLRRTG